MKTNYTWNRFSIMLVLLASITIFFQCDKESDVMIYKISGIVTYANDIPADGAVVTISSDDSGAVSINKVETAPESSLLMVTTVMIQELFQSIKLLRDLMVHTFSMVCQVESII